MRPVQPILLTSLFPPLYEALYDILDRLQPADWDQPTAASAWSVKDVVAHLLDGDIRQLSFQRDGWTPPEPEQPITDYASLVDHLNTLNNTWTQVARRMSPSVLIGLLRWTGPQVCDHFASRDPHAEALFGVAWAGQDTSPNWFDVAREYTERWHHQQQVREAVGAPLLTDPKWLRPYLDTLVRGLPHAYRNADAPPGTRVTIEIQGEAGGTWTLQRAADGWTLYTGADADAAAHVRLPEAVAWRLFSKMADPEEARSAVSVSGDERLSEPLFRFVGFMV